MMISSILLMNDLEKLVRIFEKFPGVGTRQARRFAYHVLSLPDQDVQDIQTYLVSIRDSVIECTECRRYFTTHHESGTICEICQNQNRDREKLIVVAHDHDFQAIERSGVYNGLYFILGGTIPLLAENEIKRVRINGLKQLVAKRITQDNLSEIILGFPVNPDGENTARFVCKHLAETLERKNIKIVQLGRGLSTGSELEYADAETLKNAFGNRTSHDTGIV